MPVTPRAHAVVPLGAIGADPLAREGARTIGSGLERIPVLLVSHGEDMSQHANALNADSRVTVVVTETLMRRPAVGFGCVVLATSRDPLEALVYAMSAGVSTPIVIAKTTWLAADRAQVQAAGASGCVSLPITGDGVEVILLVCARKAELLHSCGTTSLLMDPVTHTATLGERTVHLTQREYCLLYYLSTANGRPVEEGLLCSQAIGLPQRSARRITLEYYVSQLRKKLRVFGEAVTIETVRGFGYAIRRGTSPSD